MCPRDGRDGKPGRDGKDGESGAEGPRGLQGERGLQGLPGKDGINGKDGLPGRDGDDGAPGKDGRDGVDGKDGQPGADGKDGSDGIDGEDGVDGWSPLLAVVADGERRVHQVIGWTGGEGEPPQSGFYLSEDGPVATAAEATDLRGSRGPMGPSGGTIGGIGGGSSSGSGSGEQGPPGPQGPTGATGAQGEPGEDATLADSGIVEITDSTNAAGVVSEAARADHQHAHGNRSGGSLHAVAVAAGAAGFLSGADKTKLDDLGTAAFEDTGTSGHTLPFLDGANTWSALQTFSSRMVFGSQPDDTTSRIQIYNSATNFIKIGSPSSGQLVSAVPSGTLSFFRLIQTGIADWFFLNNATTGILQISSALTGLFLGSNFIEQRSGAAAQVFRVHRTWTDASNYERQTFQSGAGYFEWAAETAGSGTDDIDLRLTPAGTGVVSTTKPFRSSEAQIGGAPGAATSVRKLPFKKTGIADNTATSFLRFTVPNANHVASVLLRVLTSNGGTDAFESSRMGLIHCVLARTVGLATVLTVGAVNLSGIATVSGGATHTIAIAASAVSGADSATQTVDLQITIDDSGNVGSNQLVGLAELINGEASGVTIAAV